MRIGTWNLEGKWSDRHRDILVAQNCDVWLLTEVRKDSQVEGYHRHLSVGVMARGRHWAGILSRDPLIGLSDPHPASAAARLRNITYCSTVLPWRVRCDDPHWGQGSHAEKTGRALTVLKAELPRSDLVWGGDWNLALVGAEGAGSLDGRAFLLQALAELGLVVPTTHLMHHLGGCTIDHVAVPSSCATEGAWRVLAECGGKRLSDHDAYVVEVAERSAGADQRDGEAPVHAGVTHGQPAKAE